MAWFLNGNWDCLTTPPGASVNDLPLIMEQIARAINERSIALGGAGTQWKYTDALDVSATFPTAAQFAGIRVNGPCVRQFLQLAESWQETGDGWYTSATFATEYDSTSWAALFADLDAFDITKSATYAPNWLRIQRALNAKRWTLRARVTSSPDSEITQNFMLEEFVPSDGFLTPEEAWAEILGNTSQVANNLNSFQYVAKIIEESSSPSGFFGATSRVIEDTAQVWTPRNTGATVLGLRLVASRSMVNTTPIIGDPSAPAIGGTAQVRVNGNLISGWDEETSALSATATKFHLDESATYEISLGFSDGDDGQPSVATSGAPGSYVGMPSITWLVDLQPALTIA